MSVGDRAPRVVYFGMFGVLSRASLAALLDAGVDVRAVVVPPRGDDAPSGVAVRRLLPPVGFGARPRSLQQLLRQTVVELAWEREKLKIDLAYIQEQTRVQDEFLTRVADDPTLAERLAQRQMKIIREGTRVLKLKGRQEGGEETAEMSPFHLVAVSPPPPLPPYKPIGGPFASLFYQPRTRLYLLGGGLMLLAAGLVLGFARR